MNTLRSTEAAKQRAYTIHAITFYLYCRGETEDYYYTDDLAYVTQTVGSKANCAALHNKLVEVPIPSDHFCVIPDPIGKVSCPGDSGGPYVYKASSTSRPLVVGVVSYGPDIECGEKGNMDFPTSVPFWRKWISSMIVKYKLQN
jgi:secreted trypsin-like serine protease